MALLLMTRYSTIPTRLDLPALENAVLERWHGERTFERSVEQRAGAPLYAFDDGPPFATGRPHYGHILTSYMKDVVPRYFTMRGYRVPRRWGWDCHGLPVEYEVEKELGLSGRGDIVAMGLARFTDACRSLVLRHADEWERVVTRLGRWVDFGDAYKTMDRSYMESVLWAFCRLHELGLLYEGHKVVPYCIRCQTPLSNFEARLDDAYRPRTDLSCVVKFRLADDPNASLLAWTTTPWTLPSNVALAVNPGLDYVDCVAGAERVWLASNATERFPQLTAPRRRAKGRELLGLRYTPPFPYFASVANAFVVLSADFVSADEGTGIVHLAPAFGEDDEIVCREAGIAGPQPVLDDGTFAPDVADFAGASVLETSPQIVSWLTQHDLIFEQSEYLHDYPHCWRCDWPLIYRAVRSWFVRVTTLKETLLAHNQQINWVPEHIRAGRFGQWLENARDWAISRNRFWGSPIPVWRCEACANSVVIQSVNDLETRAGRPVPDLHRPYIDEVRFPCDRCAATMARVPEVLDCWFESGSMPFAQVHYPFEQESEFAATFPADFIVEYVAQTRGWFYTLHVLAGALFEKPAFRNAVCHGVLLGVDGRKMSKRLKNYPDPMDLVAQHGSDALRIALLSSPVVRGVDIRFNQDGVRDAVRRFVIPLWNAFHYFTSYAALDGFEPRGRLDAMSPLDRYLLHETEQLRLSVEGAMERYDFGAAYDAIEAFIETLSGWYLRLSRSKAWSSGTSPAKTACYEVLHLSLDTTARVVAPFMPFVADALYQSLGPRHSVHLADWPTTRGEWSDERLAAEMRAVRTIVRLARSIRERLRIKHRHPLPALYVGGVDSSLLAAHADLLKQEVNVKNVEVLSKPDRYVTRALRLNTPDLSKRLKQRLPALQRAVAAADYVINPDGTLSAADVVLHAGEYSYRMEVADQGEAVAAEGRLVVLLDVARDDSLRMEGDARDLNRVVQDLRKRACLHYSDRIVVSILGSGLEPLLAAFGPWLMEQALAVALTTTELHDSVAAGLVTLGSGSAHVAIGLAPSDRRGPAAESSDVAPE
ncbi:MAG: isoleucine--tRNA ligase [Luteitalea sp.]|nr:isoleucine--tRNA ligase [Luteitalea sp.]